MVPTTSLKMQPGLRFLPPEELPFRIFVSKDEQGKALRGIFNPLRVSYHDKSSPVKSEPPRGPVACTSGRSHPPTYPAAVSFHSPAGTQQLYLRGALPVPRKEAAWLPSPHLTRSGGRPPPPKPLMTTLDSGFHTRPTCWQREEPRIWARQRNLKHTSVTAEKDEVQSSSGQKPELQFEEAAVTSPAPTGFGHVSTASSRPLFELPLFSSS